MNPKNGFPSRSSRLCGSIAVAGIITLLCSGSASCEAPVSYALAELSELSMEQLMQIEVENVVTATRFSQQVTEAPASMSVITSDDIRRYGYRTLADVLRSVPGMYVTYDRNYSYLGVRGFSRPGDYNSRFLLMIDGHRLNDSVFDTAAIGTEFPLDIDLIDHIEVMRGPGSSLYGSNAFFGVINIITRTAEDVGRELSASGGDHETWSGRASYGATSDSGQKLLISGTGYDSAGQRLYFPEYAATPSSGHTDHSDGDSSKSIYARFSHDNVTLTGLFSSREKGIPTGAYQTVFNDPATRTTDERGYLNLGYQRAYSDTLEVSAQLFYDHYHYDGTYMTDNAASAATRNLDTALGSSWGADTVVTFIPVPGNRLSLGLESRQSLAQNQKNVEADPYFINLDDQRSSLNWGGFIQDEYHLLKPLRITVGFRYDNYDSFDSVSPRAALVYTPVETTALKLLYGEAFRAPNAYERYYQDGTTAIANPELKPEKIRTVDAIWEQYFLDNYRTSLGGFYYRVTDLISQTTDNAGMLVYRNIDAAEAVGVAASLEGFWQSGLKGRLSYNWQLATDVTTGAQLSNSPRHLATANVSIPLIRQQLFISPEIQYASPRVTLNGDRTNDPILANLTLFCRDIGLKGLEASASIYNLFNVAAEDVAGEEHGPVLQTIRQDGRNFRIKLSYRF